MYGRHSPFPFQDASSLGYPPSTNGLGSQMMGNTDPLSSDAVTAAMSAVRQQMCNMVAAAQQHQHPSSDGNNVIGGFHLPSHLSVHPNISIPKLGSPENLTPTKSTTPQHIGSPPTLSHMPQSQHKSNFASSHSEREEALCHAAGLSITRLASPSNDAHDLRIISPEVSPPTSPTTLHERRGASVESGGEPSSVHFRAASHYADRVETPKKNSQSPTSLVDSYKDTPIKIEADCRGE